MAFDNSRRLFSLFVYTPVEGIAKRIPCIVGSMDISTNV